MGINDIESIDKKTMDKFSNFVDMLLSRENIFFALRNNGAKQTLLKMYNNLNISRIHEMPDCGFFVLQPEDNYNEIVDGMINVAINIAADMLYLRFPNESLYFSEKEFVVEFFRFCNELLESNERIRIIFVPHIYADYLLIVRILCEMKDILCRTRVAVAPYLSAINKNALYNIGLYRKCQLAICMRNHANICAIGLGTPTIGIPTLQDTNEIFNSIDYGKYVVQGNRKGLKDRLLEDAEKLLSSSEDYRKYNLEIKEKLEEQIEKTYKDMQSWFENLS